MGKQSKGTDKSTSAKSSVSRDVKLTLLSAAVSATLRLVIPVMGLFLLGLAVDALLHQMATWAIVGAVAGFVLAAYLIFRQIRKIQKTEAGKETTSEKSVKEKSPAETKTAKKTPSKEKPTKKSSDKKEKAD